MCWLMNQSVHTYNVLAYESECTYNDVLAYESGWMCWLMNQSGCVGL